MYLRRDFPTNTGTDFGDDESKEEMLELEFATIGDDELLLLRLFLRNFPSFVMIFGFLETK